MPCYYALALKQYLEAHPRSELDVCIEKLKQVLARRGHSTLYPRIISEFKKEIEKDQRSKGTMVTIASQSEKATALKESERIAESNNVDSKHIQVTVDEDLIGGFLVQGPGFRFDNSTRSKLQALYKSLTKAN